MSQAIRAILAEIAAQPEPDESSRSKGAARLYDYFLAIRTLDQELEGLRSEFELLWMARARRSEIHVSLGYFANLRVRYRAASAWLLEQRRALLAGEPIDAELVAYDVGDYGLLWQRWPDM